MGSGVPEVLFLRPGRGSMAGGIDEIEPVLITTEVVIGA